MSDQNHPRPGCIVALYNGAVDLASEMALIVVSPVSIMAGVLAPKERAQVAADALDARVKRLVEKLKISGSARER